MKRNKSDSDAPRHEIAPEILKRRAIFAQNRPRAQYTELPKNVTHKAAEKEEKKTDNARPSPRQEQVLKKFLGNEVPLKVDKHEGGDKVEVAQSPRSQTEKLRQILGEEVPFHLKTQAARKKSIGKAESELQFPSFGVTDKIDARKAEKVRALVTKRSPRAKGFLDAIDSEVKDGGAPIVPPPKLDEHKEKEKPQRAAVYPRSISAESDRAKKLRSMIASLSPRAQGISQGEVESENDHESLSEAETDDLIDFHFPAKPNSTSASKVRSMVNTMSPRAQGMATNSAENTSEAESESDLDLEVFAVDPRSGQVKSFVLHRAMAAATVTLDERFTASEMEENSK